MNVLDLLRTQGIEARKMTVSSKRGPEYWSPCPGCGGENRFHVWPEQKEGRGSWWCRGCDKAGDDIQFLRDFQGMDFKTACAHLNRPMPTMKVLQTPTVSKPKDTWIPVRAEKPEETWQKKADEFVSHCHEALLKNTAQLNYLAERGIKPESVRTFRLGWHQGETDKGSFRAREAWGLATIKKDNGRNKALWFPQGIVIPQIVAGEVMRIRIRRPIKDPKKYYILPGSGMTPMVFSTEHTAFLVEEAELDGILLHQEAGDLVNVVALGGTTIRPDASLTEKLRASLHIMVSMDFERGKDGSSPGAKACSWWLKHFSQAENWPVPEGKDPGEAFQAGVDLHTWVLAGLPPAWRVVASKPKTKKNEPIPTAPQPVSAPKPMMFPEEVPLQEIVSAPVKRLFEIFCETGAGAICSEKRLALLQPRIVSKSCNAMLYEASNLIFTDDDVFDYLWTHPADIVHRGNFWMD